jgi:hypothetical protein
MTPAINLCHGVVDTSNKFITGVVDTVDTAEQLSLVTTKLAINLSPVSMTLVNNDRRVTKTPVITFSPVSMTPVSNYHQ